MTPETKEKLIAWAKTAKEKAIAAGIKCKDKTVETWKSGRKGKAIYIGVAVAILLVLVKCGGGRGGANGGGRGDSGRGGTFTGKDFAVVFVRAHDDEGVIYQHTAVWHGALKVLQGTTEGNLVGRNGSERVVWVETPGRLYEDGENLDKGYYVRRGSYSYEGIDGGEHTVGRYVAVTDEGTLEKIRKQLDDEKAAAEKAELDAEGKPIEVDAPVKSLCGFAIGATPSSVTGLFKQARMNADRTQIEGELATPFRYFGEAELSFREDHPSGGKHLYRMVLKPVGGHSPLKGAQENCEEVARIAEMLEKKFGIKFEPRRAGFYTWDSTGGDESIRQSITLNYLEGFLYMEFESDLLSRNEKKALAEQGKPAKLSADAGADQL